MLIVAYGFDPIPFPGGREFSTIKAKEWGGRRSIDRTR